MLFMYMYVCVWSVKEPWMALAMHTHTHSARAQLSVHGLVRVAILKLSRFKYKFSRLITFGYVAHKHAVY